MQHAAESLDQATQYLAHAVQGSYDPEAQQVLGILALAALASMTLTAPRRKLRTT